MAQQPSAQPRPGDYDDRPHIQYARRSKAFGGGWNPIAPTPDLGYDLGSPGSPASPPRTTRVAFAPETPYTDTTAGAKTPSSVGLGIDHASQSPGYHPVYSRDPYQVFPDNDSPHHGDASSKTAFQQPQEYLLSSPNDAPYYSQQYGGSPPPGGPEKTHLPFRWRLVSSAWPMYFMFFLGVAFATGHHSLYEYLDRRPADDQILMMRFGSLLSYASKSCLLAAVVFAYRQQVWVTARRKVLKLRTVDSLFAAVDEPLALLNWEFIKMAKVAVGLAILAWFFPLTVILTPAALTVGPLMEHKVDQCHGVRTLNFEAEKKKNWRKVDRINGYRAVSLSTWESTLAGSSSIFTPFNETFLDYWIAPSAPLSLVSDQSALTGNVIPRPNVAIETCGAGWNCSYIVSFKAPGYKCDELARGRKLDGVGLKQLGVPFDTDSLAPTGTRSYITDVDTGDYYNTPMLSPNGTEQSPFLTPPYPKNLGAFKTEPVLWVGYSIATGSGTPPTDNTTAEWDNAFEASVFRCEHYLTNYTVQFNHTFSGQITTILKREYLHPIINTTIVPGKNASDGTMDKTVAVPESKYVFPLDYENYRLTAAYHGLGFRLRTYLRGYVQYIPYADPRSEVSKTRLIDTETYLPVPNLMDKIQQLYENMTFSLFSNPQFLAVAWAAQPDTRSGISDTTDPSLSYPCTKTRIANAYFYNRRDLWIAYMVAIMAAGVCVVLGTAALSQNNYHLRDVHVSSIVAATRAPCLENLPWKSSKWGEVPDEILNTKWGYGPIAEPGPNGTPAAMGMSSPTGGESYVMSGKVYYGFAPHEVIELTRVRTFGLGAGKPRARGSALSFRTWEHGYFK